MDLIKTLRDRRAALKEELKALLDAAEQRDNKAFSEDEKATYDAKLAEARGLDERIDELIELEAAERRADESRAATGLVETRVAVTAEPNPVYRPDRADTSFFRDLFNGQVKGDQEARGRLVASQETRAGDLTTAAGAGGEFAPPLWLVEEFVALARPGRVTADVVQNENLPSGVSSINLPKVSTGTSTALQSTQNTALSDTALTTGSVSSGISTIGGKQIVSMQLLQQSGIPFDRVVLSDLARSYAVTLDTQVVNAISGLSGAIAVATTATGVTASGGLYLGVANAIQQIETNRFLPPTAIVMHPRRWAALVTATDTNGRPLVVLEGAAFNQAAQAGANAAQGRVGSMLGVPVYTDPSVPTNKGAGTNQDQVYVMVADDLWLYESQVQAASFDATYADQASILFRVLGYFAFIPNRYPKSVAVLDGAGLVPPTF
ncbi:MAG TPA: phage major capsid protein [Acidimicrobiales bacterium]|nr:phage major capsid protein [Acidimicrobiales bacterium]